MNADLRVVFTSHRSRERLGGGVKEGIEIQKVKIEMEAMGNVGPAAIRPLHRGRHGSEDDDDACPLHRVSSERQRRIVRGQDRSTAGRPLRAGRGRQRGRCGWLSRLKIRASAAAGIDASRRSDCWDYRLPRLWLHLRRVPPHGPA